MTAPDVEPPGEQLLERDRELRELRTVLNVAQHGSGRVGLIEAPAGIGKTSLMRAAVDAAAGAGFTALRARATELERAFAYGCVRQLLEPVVARAAERDREQLFEGAAALSRPLFVPSGAPALQDSAFSMLHGLYWLLDGLTDAGPVVLAVDDIHWSDVESLRFFNYLAPRLDGLPLAVLATSRSGEAVTADLARLAAAPETTVVRPRPLGLEATATLCARRLGGDVAPEFAAACREATGGNPLFLEALLREVAERGLPTGAADASRVRTIGPSAVADAVLLRLAERPAAATALVGAVAVIGDGASLAEAARLAGLTEPEAAVAADLLGLLSILRSAAGLEFTHPIVREAVYADLGAHERAQAHARAAAILAAGGASEERVAAQLVEAEPAGDPDRVALLRRVASDALVRGAPAAAVGWLSRALAEPPPEEARGAVLLELSLAELRLGTPRAAVGPLEAAAHQVREPQLVATAVRLLAGALTWSGDADRAVEAIGAAMAALGGRDRELELLLEADRSAYAQQGSLAVRAPVRERLERYADLPGATPGERLVLASLAFERARASATEREAVAIIEAALAGDRLRGEQEMDVAGTLYLLVVCLLGTDALDLCDALLAQMLADARARGSIPAQAFVILHRGWAALRRGTVVSAEADARTALDLLTSHEIRLGTSFALGLLVETQIADGELEEAERALRDHGGDRAIAPGMATNALLQSRALLRMAQGRQREASDDLRAFGRNDERWGGANPLASRWRSHDALALASLGEQDAALELARDDVDRARRWGAASGVGSALRALALVQGGCAPIALLEEAVDALAASPARLDQARALTDLGAALRRANRRSDARAALQRGLELAQRCGARAVADHARSELRIAGGPTVDPHATGVEQLTASERRVAELAAEGLSNPEIAQALFVTRKTVETHLGRVYRKLGIASRTRLTAALADGATDA